MKQYLLITYHTTHNIILYGSTSSGKILQKTQMPHRSPEHQKI